MSPAASLHPLATRRAGEVLRVAAVDAAVARAGAARASTRLAAAAAFTLRAAGIAADDGGRHDRQEGQRRPEKQTVHGNILSQGKTGSITPRHDTCRGRARHGSGDAAANVPRQRERVSAVDSVPPHALQDPHWTDRHGEGRGRVFPARAEHAGRPGLSGRRQAVVAGPIEPRGRDSGGADRLIGPGIEVAAAGILGRVWRRNAVRRVAERAAARRWDRDGAGAAIASIASGAGSSARRKYRESGELHGPCRTCRHEPPVLRSPVHHGRSSTHILRGSVWWGSGYGIPPQRRARDRCSRAGQCCLVAVRSAVVSAVR